MRITTLPPVPTPNDRKCVRCSKSLTGKRRKYCSDLCSDIMYYERNWDGLRFLTWARDRGRCVKCGLILSIRAIYRDTYWDPITTNFQIYWIGYWLHHRGFSTDVSYTDDYYIGPKLPMAEIDHIQAISLGGESMDLDNLQTLCHSCHAVKTGWDRKRLNASRSDTKFNQLSLDSFF